MIDALGTGSIPRVAQAAFVRDGAGRVADLHGKLDGGEMSR